MNGSTTYQQQSSAAGRELLPDLVRSFAILGIVLVNVGALGFSSTNMFFDGLSTAADKAAFFGVHALFLGKSYTLFAFMFGVGFAYQIKAAERRGAEFAPRYFRRMAGLFVLGLVHVWAAFLGDILTSYAALGCALYLFKDQSIKTLKRWAIALLSVQIAIMALSALAIWMLELVDPDILSILTSYQMVPGADETTIMRSQNFLEVANYRMQLWALIYPGVVTLQGPGIMAFFLFGLMAVKNDAIADPGHAVWRRGSRWPLIVGLILSGAGATLALMATSALSSTYLFASALLFLGAPFSTWGYLGLIAGWAARPDGRLKTFMARGGTATLTAYLLQSLILSLIFCGYGFALYQSVSVAQAVGIGALTGLATLTFTSLWRVKYARGPMEMLLRRWTYLGKR